MNHNCNRERSKKGITTVSYTSPSTDTSGFRDGPVAAKKQLESANLEPALIKGAQRVGPRVASQEQRSLERIFLFTFYQQFSLSSELENSETELKGEFENGI